MWVTAKNIGFYDGLLRKVGDNFECHSEEGFSNSWMIKLEAKLDIETEEPESKTILETIRTVFKVGNHEGYSD